MAGRAPSWKRDVAHLDPTASPPYAGRHGPGAGCRKPDAPTGIRKETVVVRPGWLARFGGELVGAAGFEESEVPRERDPGVDALLRRRPRIAARFGPSLVLGCGARLGHGPVVRSAASNEERWVDSRPRSVERSLQSPDDAACPQPFIAPERRDWGKRPGAPSSSVKGRGLPRDPRTIQKLRFPKTAGSAGLDGSSWRLMPPEWPGPGGLGKARLRRGGSPAGSVRPGKPPSSGPLSPGREAGPGR
jgi:hypothetical protein